MAHRNISLRCRTWSQSGHSGHRVSRANEDAPSKAQKVRRPPRTTLGFVALDLCEGERVSRFNRPPARSPAKYNASLSVIGPRVRDQLLRRADKGERMTAVQKSGCDH